MLRSSGRRGHDGGDVACGNEARAMKSPGSVLEGEDGDGGGTQSMKGLQVR